MKAKISEIFDSVQGEGIYIGEKQIFVRFFGCNLSCKFCDTKSNYFKEYEPQELFEELKLYKGSYHSVSFTGGEPLLQREFLKEILKLTRANGFSNYLETNGTLPENLKELIDYFDVIAMDIKLPSSTGLRGYWQEHKEFLKIAFKKEAFVKMVICNSTEISDLKQAIDILVEINKDIPLVLQPNFFEMSDELMDKISRFRIFSLGRLTDVRIIPQMHKIIGVK